MTNQLFETIYNGCNSIAENAYLESPLDTELKPPMLMEDIYFEYNVKPLFEQALREMAILNKELFMYRFESALTSLFDGKHSNKLNTNTIGQIVESIILNNRTTQDPFAIVENNDVLVINDACNEYQKKLQLLIERKHSSFIIKKYKILNQ
jgi:hypothetical protein